MGARLCGRIEVVQNNGAPRLYPRGHRRARGKVSHLPDNRDRQPGGVVAAVLFCRPDGMGHLWADPTRAVPRLLIAQLLIARFGSRSFDRTASAPPHLLSSV